jgi:hypothetical protein
MAAASSVGAEDVVASATGASTDIGVVDEGEDEKFNGFVGGGLATTTLPL